MENTKTQTGIQAQGAQIQPSSNIAVAQQPQPVLNETIRQKMTQILGEILGKAQEVGFELATLDCPHANNCPLVKKSRELIVVLKKLFELRKELEKT